MLIARNPEVCAAELDGEICLFEPVKAEYLNLNATGSAIWNLLEQPTEVEQLLTALQSSYALKRGMLQQHPPA
jgi:hypothetical protein